MDFRQIVRRRMEELDTNTFAVEVAHGMPRDAIRNVLRSEKKSGPTLARAEEIAAALGLEFYIGPPRPSAEAQPAHSFSDFEMVKRYDVNISAGPGSLNSDNPLPGDLAFRCDWLHRLGLSATNAVAVTISGDSMEPLLHDGDTALLDTRQGAFRNNHVYGLVDVDGTAKVKRLHKEEDVLILQSDNPDYPPLFRKPDEADQVKIIGRVVWSGHSWR